VSTSFCAALVDAWALGATQSAAAAISAAHDQRNRKPTDPHLITDPDVAASSGRCLAATLTHGQDNG